ncbi:hypothetical protein TREMEDRAFT_66380 [Tremella mesenterica DSM 1558]|uniref:uncharacterized protein n=1 Tax=Tremella mesenterica (strain ATCC 24925 / CBS 8224 / DSM 1558 / NBRC 9311 / NRRL Y-6157 / RJB 2259-6 / UBC 559-6) TaxID=578456 RepID=UPI00032CC788|nr:uncharacterized protein TREMEDRAFT_66380 [Tremella mesenterica DSM 1558]EIW65654.1 hypothetical protein TREMEDRAFT_66380 [Tremella mesenterica DSM 1558]
MERVNFIPTRTGALGIQMVRTQMVCVYYLPLPRSFESPVPPIDGYEYRTCSSNVIGEYLQKKTVLINGSVIEGDPPQTWVPTGDGLYKTTGLNLAFLLDDKVARVIEPLNLVSEELRDYVSVQCLNDLIRWMADNFHEEHPLVVNALRATILPKDDPDRFVVHVGSSINTMIYLQSVCKHKPSSDQTHSPSATDPASGGSTRGEITPTSTSSLDDPNYQPPEHLDSYLPTQGGDSASGLSHMPGLEILQHHLALLDSHYQESINNVPEQDTTEFRSSSPLGPVCFLRVQERLFAAIGKILKLTDLGGTRAGGWGYTRWSGLLVRVFRSVQVTENTVGTRHGN